MTTVSSFSYGKIAAIGSGFFGLTLVWSVYNTFMPLLLARFIEQASVRGFIMSLDNLLAVALIPVVGAWSDGLESPLGKRLPFIAVGMPLAALLFVALPFSTATLLTLLAVDVLFLLAMTLFRAPVIALMPDHTPEAKRSPANGVINLMGGVGGILAFLVFGRLHDAGAHLPFLLAGVTLLVAFAVLFFAVDKHPRYVSSTAEQETAALGLLKDVRVLLEPQHIEARLILLAIFFYFVGYSGLEAQFSTYAVGTLGVTGGTASLLLGLFSVAFVVAALPAGFVGNRYGQVPVMLAGLLTLGVLFFAMATGSSLATLRLLLVAAGIAWALVNVQAYPLVADLGNTTRIGFFTGMYYLFSMGASILGPPLAGLALDTAGGNSLFVLTGAAMVAGLVCLWLARLRGGATV